MHVRDEKTVVARVDALLLDGIAHAASDIHLEPTPQNLRVRFRLDGHLYDQKSIDSEIMQQIISRIKVLAHMDIAEKRIPQDGKLSIQYKGRPVDLRVSTFPSLHGEKLVVRILDRAAHAMSLDQLGFQSSMLNKLHELIKKQSGLLLVTGPTGSGKTTTLYAILSALNSPEKNIVTLEDPVEFDINGITQGYIHPEAGFTFEKGIRSLLRQDPDILMVGEIRDKQTAHTAIEAALTGHLVLSTLHTNDASSTIMRLMDMGIEPYLLNASLIGIIAQRLARKLCSACKITQQPTPDEKQFLNKIGSSLTIIAQGKGCATCDFIGYKGRTGIFELLFVTPALRSCISERPMVENIYNQAIQEGMQPLLYDGIHKVEHTIIDIEECGRVLL
jgi:type IV pilus assembly protein PilB